MITKPQPVARDEHWLLERDLPRPQIAGEPTGFIEPTEALRLSAALFEQHRRARIARDEATLPALTPEQHADGDQTAERG